MQVVPLGSDPMLGMEKTGKGGGAGSYQASDHCGQPEFSPARDLWEPLWSGVSTLESDRPC